MYPRTVMVGRPAARRFRTHWTSPQGAHTQRLPETPMIATGVALGRPLFQPRMVKEPFYALETALAEWTGQST